MLRQLGELQPFVFIQSKEANQYGYPVENEDVWCIVEMLNCCPLKFKFFFCNTRVSFDALPGFSNHQHQNLQKGKGHLNRKKNLEETSFQHIW